MYNNFFAILAINTICITASALTRASSNGHLTGNIGFKTEPYFVQQNFEGIYKTHNLSLLSPGYIFVALMQKEFGSWGPRIYDHDSNIIWYGSPSIGETRITDFHVCDYLDSKGKTLCWHDRKPNTSPTSNVPFLKKIFVDNTYSLLHNYTTLGDGHEFHVVDQGTKFLSANYRAKPRDLRPYCGIKHGWIEDACIVEYGVQDGQETWNWCLADYLPLHESTVFFKADPACQKNDTVPKAGKGTKRKPWDIGHLNAIDKDANGDYIASFRHLDEIIKIAGPMSTQSKPGTILWRLGGKHNQFKKNFNFSRQHMVRIIAESLKDQTMTITLFNNAWEGVLDPIANASSGQIIQVDVKKMRAELLHEYRHPYGRLAGSRGSMQLLPNGNIFIGWGNLPEVSEFSPDGTLVYHAQFAPLGTYQYSYRAFKSEWTGRPTWPPRLLAYSKTCRKGSPLLAYVSWNGATEVRKWRFRTAFQESGPWSSAEIFNKTGFETQASLSISTAVYVSVDALDIKNNVLGSVIQETYTPCFPSRHSCTNYGCTDGFEYDARRSSVCTCQAGWKLVIIGLITFLSYLELFVYLSTKALSRLVNQ